MPMRKYFITGGAGFIGSHLVDRLAARARITVYDNLNTGRKDFIRQHLGKSDFQFVQSDLLDFDTLTRAIAGSDVVFHLAANPDTRTGIEDTGLDLKQGTIATRNVLEAMRLQHIRKIVFVSSSTIYGETGATPVSEDSNSLLPISLYGASKLACEGFISAFCHTFDMQSLIFRLANIVGGRSNHGVIFDFINKLKQNSGEITILGNGTQEKPYLYIDDCVDGILSGWERSQGRLNIFNLGNDSSTNVNSIASMVAEAMGLGGMKFSYTGGERGWRGDVSQVRYSIARMRGMGWKPTLSSDAAVRRAIMDILSKQK
ncbi:MAG: NAD-dependent epimerase/dehydratase family protein [Chloroflexota bacterium]|nr:NAD-dependent epimerase/dehydratase family protein [Chloroflexota bacterium]